MLFHLIYSARDCPDEKAIADQTWMNIVPFFHTFGCHVLIFSALITLRIIILPSFDPHTFLGKIQVPYI